MANTTTTTMRATTTSTETTRIRPRSRVSNATNTTRRTTIHSYYSLVLLSLLLGSSHLATASHAHLRGDRDLAAESRIVGGSKVTADVHPYFVQWEGAHCGGAVVHNDLVISAAHCYDPLEPPASRRLFLNSVVRGQGRQAIYAGVEVHPDYDPVTHENDFVLLKTVGNLLKTPGGFSTGVQVIPLNRNPILIDDRPVLAVGYGQTDENDLELNDDLHDVMLYYVNNQYCANQYVVNSGHFNEDLMFCTGVPGGGKDTCRGDSGGPLVDYLSRELVGLVSWGEGCAREDYSGVNARISSAAQWIDDMICAMSDFKPSTCPNMTPPQVSNAEGQEGNGSNSNGGGSTQGGSGASTGGSSGTPGGSSGTPGGSGGSAGGSGGSAGGSGSVAGDRGSADPSGPQTPMYNPRPDAIDNAPLSAGSGIGGSSNTNFGLDYPGDGPTVATNAITVNVFYDAQAQFVRWTLDQADQQGIEGLCPPPPSTNTNNDDDCYDANDFANCIKFVGNGCKRIALQQGSCPLKFECVTENRSNAEEEHWSPLFTSPRGRSRELDSKTFSDLPPGWYRFTLTGGEASSLSWMSLMAPRGMEVWGRNSNFYSNEYVVYFQITSVGIPALDRSRSSAPSDGPGSRSGGASPPLVDRHDDP